MMVLLKSDLEVGYIKKGRSVSELAKLHNCSENKINYWLQKYKIPKRTISEAIYQKCNPLGDPFSEKELKSNNDYFLMGLGLGLYWGEGTKKDKFSVRLGNSDPALLKAFITFLEDRFQINREKLRFGIQIFLDIDQVQVERYWKKILCVKKSQFYKTIVSPPQGKGTYKNKTEFGVVTIYFNNKKLRDLLCEEIDDLRRMY